MVEFRWIKTSLFLMLVLLFPAVTEQHSPRMVVRVGDEVTLPCENVRDNQDKCQHTLWLFVGSGNTQLIHLIERGQMVENAQTISDRLSVTANCSLVIKKVTVEDAGQYACRQFISGRRQGPDSQVYLFVLTMTEHKDSDKVTLSCSVSTYGQCTHTVQWRNGGQDLDKDKDTSEPKCSVTQTFPTSDLNLKSEHRELLKCEVTDLFVQPKKNKTFSLQSSEEATTATTTTTTTTTTTATTIRITENINQTSTNSIGWWLYIIVAVGFIALVVIIVTAIRCKRTKGNKTKMDENTGQRLKPLVTESAPETTQDTADPEDGVSYASISFTKKTNSKGWVQVKNDDDGEDTVTYSTVKASSSSAGASDDHSNLYATINKK